MATRFTADEAEQHDNLNDAMDEIEEAGGLEDVQAEEDQDDEEEELTFGDTEEDDSAPDLPKRLREEIKKRDRELAQAKKRLAELDKPAAAIDVGERPTREQFDWDDDAYDKAIDEWNERRLQAQQQAEQPNDLQEEAKQDVQKLTTGLTTLSYADAQEVTQSATEALTAEQQFVIASAAKEPAKLLYALGKNPDRLKALLDIRNPVKFIAEVARMETQMTTRTKTPVPPETVRRGDARPAASADKEEARLEKEAERTGDRTALIKYRKDRARKAA